jgi:manganese transport protein
MVFASGSERSRSEMAAVLTGQKGGLRTALLFAGPAVIASVAYVDPGNYATNIQAGAGYGYRLLWVVALANLIAMLFQGMSARLGIVTNKNLAEHCRDNFPKPIVWIMWAISEIAIMATDLAEFLGGAIGLALLFKIPLIVGMAVTAIVTYVLLLFERRGFRPLELIIAAFVGVIGLCFLFEIVIAYIDWGAAARGILIPSIPDASALMISVGIIGATVMPHAIFLHSGLTQARSVARNDSERETLLRYSNMEVVIALAVAGMINIAMVMMAASAFHSGHQDVAEIETAYYMLTPLLGGAAAGVFLVSLIASGISSSVVGTMAGQLVMQGFLHVRLPIWFRRLVTMIPAFVVVALGAKATEALVLSQVILSIALPVPMIALVYFTSRRNIMGEYACGPIVRILAWGGTVVVLSLNAVLLLQTFGATLPGL